MHMTLKVVPTPDALAQAAADLIAAQVQQKPDSTLLVATGNTPIPAYQELARRVRDGRANLSRVKAAQLDEYVGLAENDPRSLWTWMERAFVHPLGIKQVIRLQDPAEYDATLAAAGGIDLAILGLGPNGHLGFNEPPSGPDAPTRVLDLSPESLESNKVYWPGLAVPRAAITTGMTQILAARQVLLLVSGAHKRDMLHQALSGPETPDLPASYLRRTSLTVIADEAAWV